MYGSLMKTDTRLSHIHFWEASDDAYAPLVRRRALAHGQCEHTSAGHLGTETCGATKPTASRTRGTHAGICSGSQEMQQLQPGGDTGT